MKAKLKNSDVHRRYQQVTTCTGYSLQEDFVGIAINPLQLIFCLIIAAALLAATFIWQPLNFWLCISITTLILAALAIILGGNTIEKRHLDLESIFYGTLAAIILYGIFMLGNWLIGLSFLSALQLPSYVQALYDLQNGIPTVLIVGILLIITSPCEEIFWRGFVQRGLTQSFGANKGCVFAALLYAAVHIVSLNPILVLAALVSGLVWGFMYQKQHHIVSCIISHALWAVCIFILLPAI